MAQSLPVYLGCFQSLSRTMRYFPFVLLALIDADLIRAALRHADISITKAALWMEIDRALLERQLDGEGHLSHKRLLLLPLAFHRWLNFLGCQRYGLPSEAKRGIPLTLGLLASARISRQSRRMVKMRLALQQKARAS